MADDPTRAGWYEPVKKTGQLRLFFDDSLGKSGWDQIFKNAIAEFNKLAANHKLGITFVQETDKKKANVEAKASRGDVEFEYKPDIPELKLESIAKKTIKFSGTGVHGLCKPVLTQIPDHAKTLQWRLVKAFIYVPAAPTGDRNGAPSPAGDGVKLVIAVHEMIHACGLVDDKEHSVDDVFAWPQLRMGSTAADDRLGVLGGTYNIPVPAGRKPRTGHRIIDMPPIILMKDTANKIRDLWA